MSKFAYFPPSGNSTELSVGVTGAAVPADATYIGGKNAGNLVGVKVESDGTVDVLVTGTMPLPTGAATAAKQDTGNTSLASIDSKLTSPLTVTGPLTDTQLRATPVPVSGTVTTGGLTDTQLRASPVPVSVSGVATAANQATEIASLSSIDTKTPALGQALAAASTPVVLTAAQISTLTPLSTVAATQSGTWNITNVSGTVSLPTGAATESTLSSLNGKVTAVNTGAVVVSSSALPTGASTSALQTTGNSSLSSIDGKLGSLGQKNMAGSAPVVLASDQAAIPVSQSGTWTVQPGNTANTTAWLIKTAGKSSANAPVRNDYSSVNVTTGAYVQLVASTTTAATEIEIFDSSGQTLVLALGAAASEVNQLNIFPGGNGRIPLAIPAGTRVSIKAVSATASVGEIDINFYA